MVPADDFEASDGSTLEARLYIDGWGRHGPVRVSRVSPTATHHLAEDAMASDRGGSLDVYARTGDARARLVRPHHEIWFDLDNNIDGVDTGGGNPDGGDTGGDPTGGGASASDRMVIRDGQTGVIRFAGLPRSMAARMFNLW